MLDFSMQHHEKKPNLGTFSQLFTEFLVNYGIVVNDSNRHLRHFLPRIVVCLNALGLVFKIK